MGKIHSYPKVWAIGSNPILNLFDSPVEITEKVDGSQFSFGYVITDKGEELVCRSHSKDIVLDAVDKMFFTAVDQVLQRKDYLKAHPQTVFYGEYLKSPKHNILTYERVPKNNIVIFGARIGEMWITRYEELKRMANEIDLETVPLIADGTVKSVDEIKEFLSADSFLGGTKIEGIVVKNYAQLALIGDKTPVFGKYVSEAFKEKHAIEWKCGANKLNDFLLSFKTEARWNKAVQHLKEEGLLLNEPKDIGALMKEVHVDIIKEERDNIEFFLYEYFIDDIKRKACSGFAQWYKEQLLKNSIKEG